ncbi:MAG: SPOR domain-containing protein [Acidiferrobacter sp.]|jgi:cell division protein FtsN
MATRRRPSASRSGDAKPWIIGVITLAIGLGLGLLVAHHKAKTAEKRATIPHVKPAPAHAPAALKPPAAPKPKGPAPGLPAATQFDFYTILPAMRSQPRTAHRARTAPAAKASEPHAHSLATNHPRVVSGRFLLQAASFPDRADASRLRAELALRGLGSYIEKVSIRGRGSFYRVRLGPLRKPAIAPARAVLARLGLKPILLREARGN